MKNKCCTLFVEQLLLVLSLPEEEQWPVLKRAIYDSFNEFNHLEQSSYNQDENQDGGQDANQVFSTYTSTYTSISTSTSPVSRAIYSTLLKGIKWREFDTNWGGRRKGSGRSKSIKGVKCGYPGGDCGNPNKDCVNCKENELSKTKNYDPYPQF